MQDNSQSGTRRRGIWVRVALLVSLAVNLAVAGFVVGTFWRHDGHGGGNRLPGIGGYAAPYMLALPRDVRRDLRRQLRRDTGDDLPDRATRRAIYRRVLTVLRAQPFDGDALKSLLNSQSQTTAQIQQRAQSLWLAEVDRMQPATRAAYADAIEELLTRGQRRDGRRGNRQSR